MGQTIGRVITRIAAAAGVAACVLTSHGADAQTLKAVKERGTLICGVSAGIIGFSAEANGAWSGFDVDFCRAVAAAIFDDPTKIKFVPLSADDRFRSLQAGEIDVLSRNSTWTMGREVELGLLFPGVTYYDGQGFMIRRARDLTSALELDGSKVCVQSGTTTALNLADFFAVNGMKFEMVSLTKADEVLAAYDSGRCDVFTADASQLHAERLKLTKPDDHVILADVISKEPLGPVVRQNDLGWFNVIKWINFAMLNAEELGVTSKNVDAALKSDKPDVKRLVGTEGSYGEQLGLTKDWVVRITRHVGNYGEVYERNIGTKARLGIPRGVNQLWTAGGILYAPPIR